MYVLGTNDHLPILICGDLNSTPNSPLLKLLTKARLNYSHLSALVIAGYYEGGAKSRVIPIPLLPPEMNIGLHCTYNRQQRGDIDATAESRTGGSTIESTGHKESYKTDHKTSKNKDADAQKSSDCINRNTKKPTPTIHSEFTPSDVDVSGSRPVRSTRSIRGAKSKGRMAYNGVNMSEICSLMGSSSTTKRGRGEQSSLDYLSADDWRAVKSTPSRGSSVDDNVMEGNERGGVMMQDVSCSNTPGGRQSRASGTEDSAMESLESSISSISKQSRSGTSKMDDTSCSHTTDSTSGQLKPTGAGDSGQKECVLTHPFKLVPAYPISKSQPATVTTYHQCAFETVDYILFSPIACRTSSDIKRLSGFNLLKRKVLPSTHTLLDLGPQPHQFLSSDHLLLQATFQLSW